jgi:hypothetical protein
LDACWVDGHRLSTHNQCSGAGHGSATQERDVMAQRLRDGRTNKTAGAAGGNYRELES